VLYVAMQTVFSLVFSAMVISDEHTYGPIGTIFALLSYLIAIGVVVILGAVVGRAWRERPPGTSETGQLPPALPCSVATACARPGVQERPARPDSGSWNPSDRLCEIGGTEAVPHLSLRASLAHPGASPYTAAGPHTPRGILRSCHEPPRPSAGNALGDRAGSGPGWALAAQ
jgi:hypothetical protein